MHFCLMFLPCVNKSDDNDDDDDDDDDDEGAGGGGKIEIRGGNYKMLANPVYITPGRYI